MKKSKKRILVREHDKFVDLLKSMKDKKELALKAIFKEENVIYKDILGKHEDIKVLKKKSHHCPPRKPIFNVWK